MKKIQNWSGRLLRVLRSFGKQFAVRSEMAIETALR